MIEVQREGLQECRPTDLAFVLGTERTKKEPFITSSEKTGRFVGGEKGTQIRRKSVA